MDPIKKQRLEAKGWRVGDASDFLGLTPEESAFIEMRLAFARTLRARRRAANLTQEQLAQLIGSSQSRVAKMEKGDPSVSLDLLVKSHLALGASREDVARIIAPPAQVGAG